MDKHSLGPFQTRTYEGEPIGHVGTVDRMRAAQSFDARQCRQALAMPHLQTAVRTAVERRLRRLEKETKNEK